jgi:hypothetical protein
MATEKHLKSLMRQTYATQKQLLEQENIADSSNAAAYSQFLTRTLDHLNTFVRDSPTFVDYVARDHERRAKRESNRASKPRTKTLDVADVSIEDEPVPKKVALKKRKGLLVHNRDWPWTREQWWRRRRMFRW